MNTSTTSGNAVKVPNIGKAPKARLWDDSEKE